jgi:hypothetical protein
MPTIRIARDATMRLKRPESLQVQPGEQSQVCMNTEWMVLKRVKYFANILFFD